MSALLLVSLTLGAHAAPPAVPCATMELLDGAWLAPELLGDGARLDAPPPPDGKLLRDAYGVPNKLESDNFVIRWGSGVSTSNAQAMLDAFELSWAVELIEMDHPPPPGSDTHKFNVYVGRTGGNTPDHYGAAGYFNTDDEGWPMIVLNPSTVSDPEYGETTVAHEFYHSVQYATGSYSYEDEAAWFWEATASWIEAEVYPDNPGYVVFLFGYALLPYLEVNFFDYPDSGALQEYHQYGAFIWPRYLAEFVGDWRVVRNAWVEPQTLQDDPMVALQAEVEDLGADLDVAFMDFAARNVTWDYAHGDWYEAYVDGYADYYPSQDARVVLEVDGAGTDGPWSPADAVTPRRYGYNVIRIEDLDEDGVEVEFVGDEEGSRGGPASFGVTVVHVAGGVASYEVLGHAVTSVGETVDVSGDDETYVVIGAWTADLRWDETFDYEIALTAGEGGGDGGGDGGGGGDDGGDLSLGDVTGKEFDLSSCSTGPRSAPVGIGLLVGLLGMAGRRRRD